MEQFQAVNIEQSILGSFIVDNSLGEKLKDLKENIFTVEYNKLILKVMKSLYESKLSLDIESIFIILEREHNNIKPLRVSEPVRKLFNDQIVAIA